MAKAKAPKRRDYTASISGDGVLELLFKSIEVTDSQFGNLESVCKINLTAQLRTDLNQSLNDYISMSRSERNYPRRGEVAKELSLFLKCTDFLFEFMSGRKDKSGRDAAREKIKHEIHSMGRDINRSAFCRIMMERFGEMLTPHGSREFKSRLESMPTSSFQFNHFVDAICILKAATENVVRNFDRENEGDFGGAPEGDAINTLSVEWDRLFRLAGGKRPHRIKFFEMASEFIPEGDRAGLTGSWGSVRKRIVRGVHKQGRKKRK